MVGAGLSLNSQPVSQLGFKQCGSSIADYSDSALASHSRPFYSFNGEPSSAQSDFVSTSAQGQHNLQSSSNFQSRDIRRAPVPILVPQAHEFRVNGSLTNGRGSPRQTVTRTETRNNPFWSNSSRRPAISKFPPHQGQPSKFDFSRIESEEGESYEMQAVTSHGEPRNYGKDDVLRAMRLSSQFDLTVQPENRKSQGNQNHLFAQEYSSSPPSAFPEAHIGHRQRGVTLGSEDSADRSLLESPFLDLVPLDVAQRRAAERRATGRDDPSSALRAHGSALRHATRNASFNASFPTNASNAGSPVKAPSAIATPSSHRRISRFVPRLLGQTGVHARFNITSPLSVAQDSSSFVQQDGRTHLAFFLHDILLSLRQANLATYRCYAHTQ